MRCSARRSRAAATISIARVILWMFFTESIRFLTSFWVAMAGSRVAGSGRRCALGGHVLRFALLRRLLRLPALGLPARAPGAGPLDEPLGLALGERIALGIEVGTEVVDHLRDRLAELPLLLVGELAA